MQHATTDEFTSIEVVDDGQGGLKAVAHVRREVRVFELIADLKRRLEENAEDKHAQDLLDWFRLEGFNLAYPIGSGFFFGVTDHGCYVIDLQPPRDYPEVAARERLVPPTYVLDIIRDLFVPEGDESTRETPVRGNKRLLGDR